MAEKTPLKKRVLIVDDDPGIGKVLGIALRVSGYDVVTTTSGAEAIEIARMQAPDIILLDLVMPGVTGLEVLDRVRNFSQVPVIIFSGHPEVVQFALKMGANDSIAKPFDSDLLAEKIKSVLGASRPAEGCDGDKKKDSPR